MLTPYSFLDVASSYIRAADATGTTLGLLSTDPKAQTFNVSVVKIVTMPSAGVTAGQRWIFKNVGSAYVLVQSSNGSNIGVVQGNTIDLTALQATPTTAAHWFVSGNVEYASNSSTSTTASDTTSFSYGQAGNQIQSVTTTLDRTVGFKLPILPSDTLVLELLGPNAWTPNTQYPLFRQNGSYYGMGFIVNPSTANTVLVRIASAPLIESGATWASFNASTLFWRVGKLSK